MIGRRKTLLIGHGRGSLVDHPGAVGFIRLRLGGSLFFPGLLQHSGKRVLQQDTVTSALAAIHGVFLFGVERTAGAIPALLDHLGDIFHILAPGAFAQLLCQSGRQLTRGRQAQALIFAQRHGLAALQKHLVQLHIHTAHRLVADIHGIVHAKQIALPGADVFVVILVLADHLALAVFALVLYHQTRDGFAGNIFKGEANSHFAGFFAFQQLHTHKLHGAALGIVVGT